MPFKVNPLQLRGFSFVLFGFIKLTCLIPETCGEFRFCYKGPQKMYETECPGGFLAKNKLPLSCKFYARTANVSTVSARFIGDICDPASTTYEVDAIANNEDDLSPLGNNLQQVIFEQDETLMDPDDTGGRFTPEDICTAECLESWEPPGQVVDEPLLDDGINPADYTPAAISVARALSKEMFLSILDDGEESGNLDPEEVNELDSLLSKLGEGRRTSQLDRFRNDVDDGETLRVLKLLAKSMRITASLCAPFVAEDFYAQVYKAFGFLAGKNESLILDLTKEEYAGISAALSRCLQKRNTAFLLNGTVCDGNAKVKGVTYIKSGEYWKYRLTGNSFRWGRQNPVIEAAWNAIEFVHGYCFESFVDNVMDLHTYEMALEGLFPAMVLKHWNAPLKIKSDYFWNNVLNTGDIKQTMRNLDACVVAGVTMSPFKKRLPKPYVNQENSENPKPLPPDPNMKPPKKGWKKGLDAYWKWYSRKGGFKRISRKWGYCVNTEDPDSNKYEMEEQTLIVKDSVCSNARK